MLKLVIFDFDGVIIDSEKNHYEAFCQALKALGIQISWAQYCRDYIGYTDVECVEHILRNKGLTVDAAGVESLLQAKKEVFARSIRERDLLLPGVRECLQLLCENQVPCAICSGALRGEIDFFLEKEAIGGYFPVIVAAEDVCKGKPDPQGYRLALKQSNAYLCANPGIGPRECVVVEDTVWGIQAAHGAQMRCLALRTTSQEPETLDQAEYVIDDLREFGLDLLGQMREDGGG